MRTYRRTTALAVVACVLAAAGCTDTPAPDAPATTSTNATGTASAVPSPSAAPSSTTVSPSDPTTASVTSPAPTETATPTPTATPPSYASDETVMERVGFIGGRISPKSVYANGHGLVMANNMMYSNTMTLYDASSMSLVATIGDAVDLSTLGFPRRRGLSEGAPVENAWSADGRYAYVTNYRMKGPSFGPAGDDMCHDSASIDTSFVYKVDTQTQKVVKAYAVGKTPKYIAITPDQKTLLVTNWCSFTLSVIDEESGETVREVRLGPAPRGITVTQDSTTAYVTAFATNNIYRVDLATGTTRVVSSPGKATRHVILSPDDSLLYVVASRDNAVYKIDTASGRVLDRVSPGPEPRSMAMSPDGTALYVVIYNKHLVVKIRTSDMTVIDSEPTEYKPIGVTYEPTTGTVWVASYGGAILVYADDRTRAEATADPRPEVDPPADFDRYSSALSAPVGWKPPRDDD